MNSKKTILFLVTQSELGGAQRYVFDLAKSLKEEYNIHVGFGEQGANGELAKKLDEEKISWRAIPHLKRKISLWDDFLSLFQIIKYIRIAKPDIVHLNSSKISILGSLAAKICRVKKIVYTVHGWVFNEPMPKEKKNFYIRAEKFTAKWKNKIICVSEADRLAGIQNKIAPEEKMIVVHNGIEEIKNYFSREEARKNINFALPDDKKIKLNDVVIGSIGNLYKNKGFEYLINATKILATNGLNAKTVIIGEGEERKELENWIEQLGMEKNIYLAGRIDEASRLLPAFDIYACSSVKEGLSYTIIEAMMAGLPIVVTDVGGNKELIADKQEGIVVKSENAEELAKGISSLLNLAEENPKIKENARSKAHFEFSLNRMVMMTKNVYEKN
ncbi:MAG: glycosyltransferase family 4 protein [bacterium]